MVFLIALIVIAFFSTGWFVFKSEQAKEVHNNTFLDLQTKAIVVAEKALQLAMVKSPSAAFIAQHLQSTNFFALSEPGSRAGLILVRKWLQNIQVLTKDSGVTMIAMGKDMDSYPPSILVSLKMGEQTSVLKLESSFLSSSALSSVEDLSIWSEEDGPDVGKLWTSEGFQLYNSADCDAICSTEIYTTIKEALTDKDLGSCIYPVTRASKEGKIHLWKLRNSAMGGSFVLSELPLRPIQPELVDASYVKPIKLNGKTFTTSEALEKIAEAASLHGRAVLTIKGPTGTGKTRLLTAAMAQFVGKFQKLQVIQVIPGSLFPGFTDKILTQTNGGPVLLVVEDAHLLTIEELADLNNLLDGLETPENLHAIVAFNPEELDPAKAKYMQALTREQRSLVNLELGPLTKDEATALINIIKTNPEYTVDAGLIMIEGMTLAQVWSNVKKKPLEHFIV